MHANDVTSLVKVHREYSPVVLINTYSMKHPDLYYFETIKMTAQAW